MRPDDAAALETALDGLPLARVGEVTADARLTIRGLAGAEALSADVADLAAAWQGTTVV